MNLITPAFSASVPLNAEGFRSTQQTETAITLQWKKDNNSAVNYILQIGDTEINITAPEGDGPVTHTVTSLPAGAEYTITLFTVFKNVRSSGVNITAVTGKTSELITCNCKSPTLKI